MVAPSLGQTPEVKDDAKVDDVKPAQTEEAAVAPSESVNGDVTPMDTTPPPPQQGEMSPTKAAAGSKFSPNEKKPDLDSIKSQAPEDTAAKQQTPVNALKTEAGATIIKAEKDLPKAMIKPNVLTHVIGGYIIQEANEPFAVTRQRYPDKDTCDEPPKKKQALEEPIQPINTLPPDMVECEHCGKAEHKSKLKKKRFCSPNCARLGKSSLSEQNFEVTSMPAMVSPNPELNNASKLATDCTPSSEKQPMDTSTYPVNSNSTAPAPNNTAPSQEAATAEEPQQMVNWTVSDVCDFIRSLPGCSDYVDDFEQQEIDGQALLLLKENHLVNAMGMKLGPALKIVAKVDSMKELTGAGGEQQ